ncbi:MAG: Crp/Fnr family transcriptional regulator [Alphaproteobacteria bacterium]|nr:Crp/Fnr family transcriptional regulator [Alphaproteobacteria bacterium]
MAITGSNELSNITLLSDLSDADRAALETRCRWREYSAHELIIDRQSTSQDIFLITRGKVRIVNYSLSGREVAFDDIGVGSHFGELAAVDGEPRSANVVALENTKVAIMSPAVFRSMLIEHPHVALSMMVRMARIIRTSTERIMDLSTLGANNRVYAELLRLAKEGDQDDNTATIKPIPIHGDIASRVSTTRETVARVLSSLSRIKLVKREASALVIMDMDRLGEMVERFQTE